MSGQYPNTFYRVAVKALIKNDKGEVLLVKEKSDKWDLPGGGLDHGESPEDGIRHELQEEIGVDNVIIGKPIVMQPFWLTIKQAWLMWVVYEVELTDVQFQHGEGVTAIEYLDAEVLAQSKDERERFIPYVARL